MPTDGQTGLVIPVLIGALAQREAKSLPSPGLEGGHGIRET